MAPSPLQQRRTHNTLLFQKLLNLRDGASPFTLVLDTLEQTGAPLICEFVRRAKIGKSKILYVSFSTLRKKIPFEPDAFVSARSKSLAVIRQEILSHLPPTPSSANPHIASQKYLFIIDTLNPLALSKPQHLSAFLSSLIIGPHISVLGTYHTDIPLSSSESQSYQPDPLTTLTYLATAILTIHNLSHVVAKKRARDKSLQEPVFGLDERREGILVGVTDNSTRSNGYDVVIEMEIRRKSGRGVSEVFVLSPPEPASSIASKPALDNISLLDDHPLYSTLPPLNPSLGNQDGEDEVETTFSLGLSEKERRARDGVVLPYFDAQKDGGASGAGEGGRILYEMGAEDREDFDDEEDEI